MNKLGDIFNVFNLKKDTSCEKKVDVSEEEQKHIANFLVRIDNIDVTPHIEGVPVLVDSLNQFEVLLKYNISSVV